MDLGVAAPSAAPQSPQNFFSGGLSAPHRAHRFASAAPQSPQNFLAPGFSDPHFEQRISRPGCRRPPFQRCRSLARSGILGNPRQTDDVLVPSWCQSHITRRRGSIPFFDPRPPRRDNRGGRLTRRPKRHPSGREGGSRYVGFPNLHFKSWNLWNCS